MSLHPESIGPVPEDTARVAHAAFPKLLQNAVAGDLGTDHKRCFRFSFLVLGSRYVQRLSHHAKRETRIENRETSLRNL